MEKLIEPKHVRKVCGAYVLLHVKSGKVYVGSSANLGYRIGNHLLWLRTGRHYRKELCELYNDDPRIEVTYFKTQSREEAYAKEQELLDSHLSLTPDKVVNIAIDVRRPQLGVPMSDEHRDKIRQARLGMKASDEVRRKMSIAQTGRKHSPEAIEKVRQIHLGRKRSEATKQAMRNNRKDVRKIMVDGVIYPSTMEASRQLNVPQPTVHYRVANPRCEGWSYV